MAAGCSKSFASKYEEELYYDVEYEDFCKNFEFSVSIPGQFRIWVDCLRFLSRPGRILPLAGFAMDIMAQAMGNRFAGRAIRLFSRITKTRKPKDW